MRKTKQEVEAFLQQFLPKFSIWGIVFLDREKNKKAIEELDLAPIAREPIVKSITTDDYIDTLTDITSWSEMWVFGKDFQDVELYIKIALGNPNNKTICISFHKAENPLNYAFK